VDSDVFETGLLFFADKEVFERRALLVLVLSIATRPARTVHTPSHRHLTFYHMMMNSARIASVIISILYPL